MKTFALMMMTVLLGGPCLALEIEKIRELANTDHAAEGIIPELKRFTNGREFDAVVRAGVPGTEAKESPIVKTFEKVVEKRYLVSQFTPPGAKGPVIAVVTFEEKAGVYQKWVLMPDNQVLVSVGTALPEGQSVSWMRIAPPDSPNGFFLTLEEHGPEKTSWREVTFTKKGQVSLIVNGVATKTK